MRLDECVIKRRQQHEAGGHENKRDENGSQPIRGFALHEQIHRSLRQRGAAEQSAGNIPGAKHGLIPIE
ncbi:MAG: hypothetical protein ALAOOOJD_02595 [bacterium]|nr:hypothetical protein [bacterium]